MRNSLTLALCAALYASGATAASSDEYSRSYNSCLKQANGDNSKMLICTNAEITNNDAELNALYKKLYTVLASHRKTLLQNNERAWIQFRDTECDFQGSQLIGGPLGIEAQAQVTFRAECMLKQTHLRVLALRDDYIAATGDGPK